MCVCINVVFFPNRIRGNGTDFEVFVKIYTRMEIEAKHKLNELKMGGQLELIELKNKQSHKYSISCIYIDDEISE